MKKIPFKSLYTYLAVLFLFVIAAYAYFPSLFEGKIVRQSDVSSWRAASNEIIQHQRQTGEETLWTNAMFGGMPSTMILARYKGNLLEPLYRCLFLGPRPASYLILALASFFLLLLAFRVDRRVAFAGALAFGFCAYNFQIMMVGHNSKMVAIALMPAVLAAMVYTFRGNRWVGAALFGVALTFEILANHPQITYYLAFIALAVGLAECARAWREGRLPAFLQTAGLLFVAATLAAGSNVNHLWPTWEYGRQTMRGGSELVEGEKSSGLDKQYATAWSYGIGETGNLLIPNFRGGASAPFDQQSETFRALARSNDPRASSIYQRLRVYWGPQGFTAGPMYMGAIAVFLFVLGLLVVRGPMKWGILAVSLLALALGWGRHFMFLSDIFHDYVPLYNKFRVPSMTLVILQVTIPLLGFLALDAIFRQKIERRDAIAALKRASGITGGICLLFALFPSLAGDALAAGDEQFPAYIEALQADRRALLRADAFRSLAYILLAGGVTWAVVAGKLKTTAAAATIAALVIADVATVDKRYLNESHFTSNREFNSQYQPRPVDKLILQDKSLDYRVLDLTTDPFNDSHASYHHKTIGGYSAAKLQRYQDMIDLFIYPEIQALARDLNENAALEDVKLQKVLNMLNTKYVIIDPNAPPLENTSAFGNAWFVAEHELVGGAIEEVEALRRADPARTAVIHQQFAPLLSHFHLDDSATIQLTKYAPNRLQYATSASTPQLALFSEVYYPHGWQVTVDGEPAEHFRANYILRGMIVPAGEHVIEFRFEPRSNRLGAMVSAVSSSALILLFLVFVIFSGKLPSGGARTRNTAKIGKSLRALSKKA
ncbi:MAG: YfhO family protein, partial [Odoribacteraceae bacterium]|nr:YfhO family protein [Odoribacteraceae bacterium]